MVSFIRRPMNKQTKCIIFAMVILLTAILACTVNVGGVPYPSPVIPVSTEAVAQQQQSIQTAIAAGASSGQVMLIFTEPGLTSYLHYILEKQPNPLFTNPQVVLQENQIRIHGTAVQGNLQAYVYIVLSPSVDQNGRLTIEVASADFGPLPIPDELRTVMTAILTEAYTGSLGPVATGFRLESITIAYGMMLMNGRIR